MASQVLERIVLGGGRSVSQKEREKIYNYKLSKVTAPRGGARNCLLLDFDWRKLEI